MKNLKNAFPFLLFIFFTFSSFGQKEVKQIEPADIVGIYTYENFIEDLDIPKDNFTVEFTPSGYMYFIDENGEIEMSFTYVLTEKTITMTALKEEQKGLTHTSIWRKTTNGFETRIKNPVGNLIHTVYTKIKKSSEEW